MMACSDDPPLWLAEQITRFYEGLEKVVSHTNS
jgi:hypothetical protein